MERNLDDMAKCKDCKHLDLKHPARGGHYQCKNANRRMYGTWGGYETYGHIKRPSAPACKTGFEPRDEEGGEG